MLKSVLSLGLVAVIALSAHIAKAAEVAGTYKLDPTHASLTWKVSHLGLSFYTARFTKFDATLNIDPAKPADATLSVTVDPRSIRTDYPFADKKDFDKVLIESRDFFNANEHSEIKFVSTRVEPVGENTASVTGDLTLLGVTKPVTMDVTLNGQKMHPFAKKPAMGFSAEARLKRSAFGMTHLLGGVGDEVRLIIEAEFIKQ